MWATANQADAVVRVAPDGALEQFALPAPGAAPVGITWADDAVWFAEIGAGRIGRIADGEVTEFPLPDPACRPHAIVAGAHGCWFTEWAVDRVGHICRDGTVEEYGLPPTVSEPHGITVTPDGAVWVAAESGSVVQLR
ncbi:hypothetical protein C6A87_008500 [Mycobacterium sp. ITM-2016-00317]|uniref:Vgb family protein n=1 Tax=Mycobacterium sp. ITM-2016-00317 TaxID=2099694 RepID=UPI00287FABBE|nr:hypothetical protein [Mycobacterium sp. ITM-2016-00317]WNG89200.1 hypothetical protein C6A87_008500 [Mycobacterium sp. ITM-2016-00317]